MSFISRFEAEWLHLLQLTSESKDDYRKGFAQFLEEDKTKRDFLLSFMVKRYRNIVDNLSTKDNLSFADVRQTFLDLDRTHEKPSISNSALYTTENKPTSSKKKNENKECNYCKKWYSGKSAGHTFNNCSRVKEDKASKKNKWAEDRKKEEAHITMEDTKVRHYTITFDTACTSHIIPYTDRLKNFTICSGLVRS